MRKIILKKEPCLIAKQKAFPYQEEAFNAVKDLPYSAIFHEQGLGKTKIAIDLTLYWLEKKDIDTVLIVTKKQLVQNWVNEFKFHTHVKPAVLNNNKQNNFYIFNGASRIVITNFETISGEKERFKLYLKSRNVAIIIDESAKLKNPEAKLTSDFIDLSSFFKIKTIMTGTPVANRPYDIWSQIYFLDNGDSLGTIFEEFKKNTNLSNDLYKNKEKQKKFEENINSIYEKINNFTVRETKNSNIINLPDKKFINELVDFEKHQELLYEKVRNELTVLVEKNSEIIIDDSTQILKRLLRLVQIASNPRLIDESYINITNKEKKLDELVENIINNQEKCIIWSSFTENVDYFTRKYVKYKAVKIHGKMSIEDRNKSVNKFKIDDYNILIATPQAAKEGLTLTMANHVIFYDRGFSLDDYLQAQDRIHRISQKKTCYIYNIMIENSIDTWVDTLLNAKKASAALTQGDITINDYQKISNYNFGEVIKNILKME